jgi:sugar O-acyltransferase (sialic acid O-acetyltransferase NeuD family)
MKKRPNKAILIGAFHEVIELCESQNIDIVGIIDNTKDKSFRGYNILGTDNDALDLYKTYGNIPLIITPDQPVKRYNIAEIYRKIGYCFYNLISSFSIISKSSNLGIGVFIQSAVNISANVVLGDFVRVNTMANIMHDSIINPYATIAPNAVILGNVKIGSFSYIGANATILPGVTLGNNVIIGAGSVVTKCVKDGVVFAGNPARELRSK